MVRIVKELHTYTGLLTFINFTIYAIVGFTSMWHVRPEQRIRSPKPPVERPFTVPANLTDRQVAELVCGDLGLSLATPVQQFAIQRDAAGVLQLDLWHANGEHKVTVLESERKLRIEEYRATTADFLDTLHTTTGVFRSGDWRMQLWAYYNEFAMWSLLGMTLSGAYLWLAARAGHRVGQISFAAGAGAFAVLYALAG